ncbi:MAG: metallopeptidase TldD-related protein [candidate division WOR-3 bacterium]
MLESRIRDILGSVRDYARRQGINAEFTFHREHSGLIRLGNSAVALSTSEHLTRLDVVVQAGRRTGAYSLNADITTEAQVHQALERARENCAASPEKDYQPIFGVVEASIDDTSGFDPRLEALAEAKTELCAQVVETLKPRGNYDFSGSWSSGSTEIYLVTTANDHEAYRRLTDGRLVLVLKERAKKWELSVEQSGKDVDAFSAARAIQEFEELLPVYERNPPFRASLGSQRAVFGPQAISQLVMIALYSGFNGRGWEEKRVFTADKKPGDRVFADSVTLADDPDDPCVFRMPFDLKGRRRQRFVLCEHGIFRGLVYDAATAAKYGKAPTGHDADTTDLVFAPGTGPSGISAGRRLAGDALYIPHLHYIHMPNPAQGLMTGSSRFNALRIAGGEFVAPMLSTRITDSIANILSNVVAVAPKPVMANVSGTYGRRAPEAMSVPEYLVCDNVRISDVADSF